MENLQKAINRAKEIGWEVYLKKEKDYYYLCFGNYTPYGQDISEEFDFNGTFKDLLQQLSYRVDNFDCSYEAYLWLDDSGHGTNGSPYDMKDLYEDMEKRLEMLRELENELKELLKGEI